MIRGNLSCSLEQWEVAQNKALQPAPRTAQMKADFGIGMKYFRIHVTYKGKTGKPVGLFGACNHLKRAGKLTPTDVRHTTGT